MMLSRARNWQRYGVTAASRRLLALGVGVLVVLAALASGRSYLWCASMQQAMRDCCCPAAAEPADASASATSPRAGKACCDEHAAGELPDSGTAHSASVPIPPPLATLTEPAPPSPTTTGARWRAASAAPAPAPKSRYGPSPPAGRHATEICASLQVYRC